MSKNICSSSAGECTTSFNQIVGLLKSFSTNDLSNIEHFRLLAAQDVRGVLGVFETSKEILIERISK